MNDGILIVVTIISLGLASVMGIITWRVLRLERRRFEARVAELAAEASDPGFTPAPSALIAQVSTSPADHRQDARGAGTPEERTAPPDADPLWTDLVPDFKAFSAARTPGVPAPDLFREPEPVTTDGRRLMLAVALGSCVLLAAFSVVLALNPRPGAREATSPAAARVASPLELVALDHARRGDGLSVRGLVRNPSTGTPVRDLVAVVFLFDRSGGYIGTAQAPVLESELAPGRDTPFDVPVGAGQRVARYRLSFRVASAPVPHVDRRAPARPAAPETSRVPAIQRASLAAVPVETR